MPAPSSRISASRVSRWCWLAFPSAPTWPRRWPPRWPKASRLVLVGPATSRFAVARVPEDTLVIHGEFDDVVPLAATLDWARPQSLPVVVVPGAGHYFHGQLTLLKNLVLRSFSMPAS
jgi:alpha/beta superfamily hydrolase